MSDLQIILILLGFIIIAGVVVYNWRQEKQLRDTIRNDFLSPHKDVLTDDAETDVLVDQTLEAETTIADIPLADEMPSVKAVDIAAPETPEVAVAPVLAVEEVEPLVVEETSEEPSTETMASQEEMPATETPSMSLPDELNAQIDFTAVLTAANSISGQALHVMVKDILKELGAIVMQHGLDKTGIWHRIDDRSSQNDVFETIACSLQLVDRRGPVAKPLINKFEYAVEAIGLEFDATITWQGEGDVAQRAVELDQFCIEVDQLVSVHVLQGDTPIHGTKFRGMAEANDLKLRHGKFYCVDSENPDLDKFVLSSADEQPFSSEWLRQNVVRGIVFQVEIPKVKNVELVFNQMIIVAQKMADRLGANMVDGNKNPLGDVKIDAIKQQLKVISSKMSARGIAAGSASSMRLFN
ncbi:MAG: FtsZ-interacting cell division protein ZipA [Methylophilaceae bacterium]|jgi:FtsZ-interacting cell division protein ZipA